MSLNEDTIFSSVDSTVCSQTIPDSAAGGGWSSIGDIICLLFGLVMGYFLHRKWPEIVLSVRETLDTSWTEKIQAQDQETKKKQIENFELGISKLCNIINCHTVDVGIIIAAGKDLEIVSINTSMRRMLQWPVDFRLEPDPSKKISVNDLMPSNLQAKHQKIMSKAVEAGTLPGSLMHPLRNIEVMTYGRNESIRGSLSLGVLTNEIPLSSPDCLFYAVFVQLEESESASGSHSSTDDENEEDDVGNIETDQRREVQALPAQVNIPPQVSQRAAGEGGLENLWDNVWECTVGDSSETNASGVARPRASSSAGPSPAAQVPAVPATAAGRLAGSLHGRVSRPNNNSPDMVAISEMDMIDSLMLGDDNSDQVASAHTASGVSSNTTSRAASPDIRTGIRPHSPESPNTTSRVPSPDHPDAPTATATGDEPRRNRRQRSPDGRPLRRGARGAESNEEDCFRNVVQHIYGDYVARSISTGGLPAPEEYPEVTVLFLDVVDFAKSCMVKTSSEVATWMSRVHEVVEAMLSVYAMRKVEIRGDCYIVVSGTNSVQGDLSNTQVTRMAAFATDVGKKLASLQGTQIRVGIATGPTTIAYIGGQKFAPTLCAFGDTVNMAARMEQSGKPGMVHMTERSASLLCQERELEWGLRKPPLHMTEVKGKGLMSTAWFDWDKDDFAILPSYNGGHRGRSFVYAGTEFLSAAIRTVSPTRLLAHVQAAARSVSPVRLLRNQNAQAVAATAAAAPVSGPAPAVTPPIDAPKAGGVTADAGAHGSSQAADSRAHASAAAAASGLMTAAAQAPAPTAAAQSSQQAATGAVSDAVPSAGASAAVNTAAAVAAAAQQLPASQAAPPSTRTSAGSPVAGQSQPGAIRASPAVQAAASIPQSAPPPPTSRRQKETNSGAGPSPSSMKPIAAPAPAPVMFSGSSSTRSKPGEKSAAVVASTRSMTVAPAGSVVARGDVGNSHTSDGVSKPGLATPGLATKASAPLPLEEQLPLPSAASIRAANASSSEHTGPAEPATAATTDEKGDAGGMIRSPQTMRNKVGRILSYGGV